MGIINYDRTGDVIEITIRDYSGAKLETHTCNAKDKKKYSAILRYLKDKFGFEPEIDIPESVNSDESNKLNWW